MASEFKRRAFGPAFFTPSRLDQTSNPIGPFGFRGGIALPIGIRCVVQRIR